MGQRSQGRVVEPEKAAQNGFCALARCSREGVTTDGVQLLSSCAEYVADKTCELRWCLIHLVTTTGTWSGAA